VSDEASDEAIDLAFLYRDTRERLTAMVWELDEAELATPVPACPGWTVHDVTAHLVATGEDAVAGRLTGPPTEEQTAAQVARFANHREAEILDTWKELAPAFESIIAGFDVWPAVLDVASHEQDIRGALGRPGARDTEAIREGSSRLVGWLRPPVRMRIELDDERVVVGPEDGPELGLTTNRFDAFRWRLGRRSPAQLAAMDWSGDPAPVLDCLAFFGPATFDVIE
jgi:uncharacterized protein (TIGR03083 family)